MKFHYFGFRDSEGRKTYFLGDEDFSVPSYFVYQRVQDILQINWKVSWKHKILSLNNNSLRNIIFAITGQYYRYYMYHRRLKLSKMYLRNGLLPMPCSLLGNYSLEFLKYLMKSRIERFAVIFILCVKKRLPLSIYRFWRNQLSTMLTNQSTP